MIKIDHKMMILHLRFECVFTHNSRGSALSPRGVIGPHNKSTRLALTEA
jgi:hypothetical protein